MTDISNLNIEVPVGNLLGACSGGLFFLNNENNKFNVVILCIRF